MAEPGSDLPQAVVEQNVGLPFQKRIVAVQAKIQQLAEMASILTEEAKGKMRAVVEFSSSLQPDQPDTLGKVGLLERSLNVDQQVTRSRKADSKIVQKFIGTPAEQTIIGIMRQLNIGAGFIKANQSLELQAELRNIDPNSPTAQSQIDEIAKAVNYQPEEQSSNKEVTREAKNVNLSEAFKPLDRAEEYKKRENALRERLQEIAGMRDILTDEARAIMAEAVKYLNSLNIQDKNVAGKLGLLEDALGVHPSVYRGSQGRGVTRGG